MKIDDSTLLKRYVHERDEEAFAELVRRHADLVWGTAFRITRDAYLSQDVAQTVFVDFARKAASIPAETVLPGWLYLAACYSARKTIRAHLRRTAREARAMAGGIETTTSQNSFEELEPILDEALTQLPPADRDAILLRFFSGLSFSEIGRRLGSSDDAAQKRTTRALDRLRDHFDRQGVLTSVDGLSIALGLAAARRAPEGLASLLGKTAASTLGAAVAVTGGAAGIPLKTMLGIAVGLVAIGTAVLIPALRNTSSTPPATQRDITDDERVSPSPSPKLDSTSLAEVLRLRGILSRLRPNSPALAPPPGGFSTSQQLNRIELMRLQGAIAAERRNATAVSTNLTTDGGSIRGRVWLLGTPPPARPIAAVLSDSHGSQFHKTAPMTRTYLVSPDGGFANVYVHIKTGLPTNALTIPTTRQRMELTGTFFEPYVLGVVAGQSFEIRNGDPFLYNVNANPRLNQGFNVAMANPGQAITKQFQVAEPFIKIMDNVHPWCIGYICVAENQFHALTDANGYFTLPAGLPAGRYELEVMHLKAGAKSTIVEYRPEEPPFLGLELTVPDGANVP